MMGSEQFSLKWNNHTNHIVGVFGNLLQSESLVDVTLSCEGRSLRAHKLVLSACSPYFKSLFQDHAESHPIVILKDVKFSELRSIIQFMYNGEVEIEKNDLDSLFSTAEGLMIRGLTGSRSTFSGISPRERTLPGGVDPSAFRKRPPQPPLPPSDSGGEGGEERLHASSERLRAADSPAPPLSNGEETNSVIKRPKLEPDSEDENSNDGLVAAADTTYLCPECGLSFQTQQQLQHHHRSVHSPISATSASAAAAPSIGGASSDPGSVTERATVVRAPSSRLRPAGDEVTAATAHSHSWPPHDRLWESGSVRLPGYLHSGQFIGPIVGLPEHNSVLAGMIAGRGLLRQSLVPSAGDYTGDGNRSGPLNLSACDSAAAPVSPPAASPSGDRSAPSTPTPTDAPDGGGLVTCKVCTRVFESAAALREHASVHQGDRPYRCDWCGKAFKFRHHLKDHCRIHTGERPFDCKVCGKSFARSSILKTHAKIHKQEERRFEMTSPLLSASAAPPPLSGATPAPPPPADIEVALPALPVLPAVSAASEDTAGGQ